MRYCHLTGDPVVGTHAGLDHLLVVLTVLLLQEIFGFILGLCKQLQVTVRDS